MKNRILFLYVLFAFLLCTESIANSNYHDTQYGFHATFPSDWEVKKNYKGSYLVIISPVESKNDVWRENITFGIQKVSKTKDIFNELPQLYKQFGDALIEHTRYRSKGIERALFSVKTEVNGVQVVSYNTLFRIDDLVFSISGMSEASKNDFQGLFKNIVDSIAKK